MTRVTYFVSMAGMLKIRLQRVGRIHEPTFRLVLTDSKNSTKSGKYLEILGNYDSRKGDKAVLNSERINYWISMGAQVSPTVHNMLVQTKIITGKKVNNLPLKKAIVKETAEVPAESPKAEVVPTSSVDKAETPAEVPVPEVVETPVEPASVEDVTVEAPVETVA